MTTIFECLECGFEAVFDEEDGLNQCPKCGEVHVSVTYGVPSYINAFDPKIDDTPAPKQSDNFENSE
jgi:Zn finger protein HypA/HybF involved in hydrogenase expression